MDREAEDFRKKTMRVLIMQLNSISVMDLVAYGGFGLGVVLGLQEYLNQHITFMMFIFIVMISIEFFLPLRMLGSYFHIGQNGNAAADKIFKLLDSLDDIQESYQESISTLSFEHVTFGYDEKIILKEYLKNKRQIDLRISKQIEREVDEEIERVQKILHDKQNPQLF